MKKVIENEIKIDVIKLKDVTDHKYYGVIMNNTTKAFIGKTNFCSDNYIVHAPRSITKGNAYDCYKNESIQLLIKELIKYNNDVYEFDSYQELFKWIIE